MITEASKACPCCGAEKPLSQFYRSSRGYRGVQSYCKICSRLATKRYQAKIGKSVAHRSVRYGLTVHEVGSFLAIPACQSCGDPFTRSHGMKFDHCHSGGHFRGVLCHKCNVACAGTSSQAIPRLLACIEYLRRDLERVGEQV